MAVEGDRLTNEDRTVLAQASGMLTIFEDPISFEIMDKAMMTPCGHSFSEDSIMGWLQTHRHCPLCNKTLRKTEVLPNYALRTAIGRFLTAQRRLHASIQQGATSLSECYTPPSSTSSHLNLDDWKTIRIEDNFEGELTMTDSKLLVEVISARDLKPDWFGNANPYCVLEFQDQKKKTKIIHKNRSPKWEETFVFNVMNIHSEENLVIEVWDKDRILKDNFLGMVLIPLPEVITTVKVVRRFPLQKKRPNSRKKIRGDILLRLQFLDLRKSYEAGRTDRPPTIRSDSMRSDRSDSQHPLVPPLIPPPTINPLPLNNPINININRPLQQPPPPPPQPQSQPPPPLFGRNSGLWVPGARLHMIDLDLNLDENPPPLPPPPPPYEPLPPPPEQLDNNDNNNEDNDNDDNPGLDVQQINIEDEEQEEGELIDVRYRQNEGRNALSDIDLNEEPAEFNIEENENNNFDIIENNDNNNNSNNNKENNNNDLHHDGDRDADGNLDHQQWEAHYEEQLSKIQNEISNIIQKADDDDDSHNSESSAHQNISDNIDDDRNEEGEIHFDANMYHNNNNNNNHNEDNDEEVEEHLQRRSRSHLPEINHPLIASSSSSEIVGPPPPSLTELVAGGNLPSPAYLNVVVSESNVNSLMDMGFPRNLAELALKTCGDDFDNALDRLLNHPEELQLDILKSLFFFS